MNWCPFGGMGVMQSKEPKKVLVRTTSQRPGGFTYVLPTCGSAHSAPMKMMDWNWTPWGHVSVLSLHQSSSDIILLLSKILRKSVQAFFRTRYKLLNRDGIRKNWVERQQCNCPVLTIGAYFSFSFPLSNHRQKIREATALPVPMVVTLLLAVTWWARWCILTCTS